VNPLSKLKRKLLAAIASDQVRVKLDKPMEEVATLVAAPGRVIRVLGLLGVVPPEFVARRTNT